MSTRPASRILRCLLLGGLVLSACSTPSDSNDAPEEESGQAEAGDAAAAGEGTSTRQRQPLTRPVLDEAKAAGLRLSEEVLADLAGKTAAPTPISEELLNSYRPGEALRASSFIPGSDSEPVGMAATEVASVPIPVDPEDEIETGMKAIFGTDDRGTPKQKVPYVWVGKLISDEAWCTAALVGPRHILTAAHCFRRIGEGQLNSAAFIPFYRDGQAPFGSASVQRTMYGHIPPETGSSQDWAIGILDRRLGDELGWFGYHAIDDSWFYSPQRNAATDTIMAGYSGDWYDGERMGVDWRAWMYWRSGTDPNVVGHDGDTTSGSSGGPLFVRFRDLGWAVVGINIAGPKHEYWPADTVLRHGVGNLGVDVGQLVSTIRDARERFQ